MKKYSLIAGLIIVFLLITPIISLGNITNLSALSDTGPNQNISIYEGGLVNGDNYDFGNCTFWVALLRMQIGKPIPNTWGNAITWATRAISDGYQVDHIPTPTSIMQDPNAPGGLGHVAFVESVNTENGDWTISEMNRVGFDEIDTRVMPSGSAQSYNFIHDQ